MGTPKLAAAKWETARLGGTLVGGTRGGRARQERAKCKCRLQVLSVGSAEPRGPRDRCHHRRAPHLVLVARDPSQNLRGRRNNAHAATPQHTTRAHAHAHAHAHARRAVCTECAHVNHAPTPVRNGRSVMCTRINSAACTRRVHAAAPRTGHELRPASSAAAIMAQSNGGRSVMCER